MILRRHPPTTEIFTYRTTFPSAKSAFPLPLQVPPLWKSLSRQFKDRANLGVMLGCDKSPSQLSQPHSRPADCVSLGLGGNTYKTLLQTLHDDPQYRYLSEGISRERSHKFVATTKRFVVLSNSLKRSIPLTPSDLSFFLIMSVFRNVSNDDSEIPNPQALSKNDRNNLQGMCNRNRFAKNRLQCSRERASTNLLND